jgi:glc operon protein GlcG
MTIPLPVARAVCLAATKHAAAMGLQVSVVVVDAGGHDICMERMDGAGFLAGDIARRKAYAAVAFKRTSGEVEQLAQGKPAIFEQIAAMTGGRFLAGMGAVPVMDGDRCLGAVGVSGVKPAEDEEIARAALQGVWPDGTSESPAPIVATEN